MNTNCSEFQKELTITPGLADMSGRMSYPAAFEIFMDIASEHAERIGIGVAAMAEKHRFWLTVKTKIVYYRRPALTEKVISRTWLELPDRMRSNRNYDLRCGDELLLEGKTEWAVIDTSDNCLVPISEVYPEWLQYSRAPAFSGQFGRIPDRFDGAEIVEEYRVRSTDIDIGRHMNNAAYLRAVFGALPGREVQERNIRSVEAVFRKSAYEGEILMLQRQERDNSLDLRYSRAGETVFLARINCQQV